MNTFAVAQAYLYLMQCGYVTGPVLRIDGGAMLAWVRESLPKTLALIDGRPIIRQYVSEGSAPVARTVASD